jgi:predicted nicotinamide N-methyase
LQLLAHTLGASASFFGAGGGVAVIVAEGAGAMAVSSDEFAQACTARESATAHANVETEKPRTLEVRIRGSLA